MRHIEVGTKNDRRMIMSMLMGSLVTFAILYGPQTLIAEFSLAFAVSPSSASAVISLPTFGLAITMLFVSVFSDAWGRKAIMCASLAITSLLCIVSSFSVSFHLLLAFRLLEGISIAGFPAIALAYLNEEVAPGSIGRAIGVYVSGTAVGGFLGRVLISALTDLFSWNFAMLVLGLFSLGCSLLFWLLLPQSNHFQSRRTSLVQAISKFRAGLSNKRLFALYGSGFLLLGTYVTLFNYISFPLSKPPYHLSHTAIGFLFVFQLVGSWSSIWFGKWADRYSRALLICCAIGCSLVGSLATLYGHIAVTIAGMVLFSCGFFAGHTVASGWVGRIVSAGHQSQASSLYILFYYAGASVIGWMGGLFLGAYGWLGVVLLLCVLLLLHAALLIPLRAANPNGTKPTSSSNWAS